MIALRKYCDSAAPIKRDPSSPRRQPQKLLRRNSLSPAAVCRRVQQSTYHIRNLYQVLSYLNRIIEPSFSVVNTLFALLTHLHEFLEAN